jgi:predicted AlkP superfamily pyrophosphatase or phosphodiesterase
MHPDYVLRADEYKLKIPHLRALLHDGAHAAGVQGVLPTVTYPSHTTILTGVWPSKHGIYSNLTFDPLGQNQGGWYWYSEDIKLPTLWQAAAQAGYVTGSVNWPVSVRAPGVRYDVPEFWRARTEDDRKLMRAVTEPGLMQELQQACGNWVITGEGLESDRVRTKFASYLIRHKGVRFLTLHLAALDHEQHAAGPWTAPVFAVLEEIDKMLGTLEDDLRAVAAPGVGFCIVSDHGFSRIDHQLNLNVAFVQAGLIVPSAKKTSEAAPSITEWKAQAWNSAASAAIMLKDPHDEATRAKVRQLLTALAADKSNGIASVLDPPAIAALGGPPEAAFFVDMRPGFSVGNALEGALVRPVKGGTHGYSPTHPELTASFFIAGPGIEAGRDLGRIDMRSIAPALAKFLGVSLPQADLPPPDLGRR